MKGDLHTLQRVCDYASKVMLIGEIVLGLIIVIMAALAIGSLVSPSIGAMMEPFSEFFTGSPAFDEMIVMEYLFIMFLGMVTVREVRLIMDSIRTEYTPFIPKNADILKRLSFLFLGSSIILLILSILAGDPVSTTMFYCLGALLVCVVMYCLALIFRYGGILQTQSDETL